MTLDRIWDKAALTKSRTKNRRRAAIVRAARRAKAAKETSPEHRDPTGPLHPLASPDHDCAAFGFACCDVAPEGSR